MSELKPLSISEILGNQFFIRHYQRGYRWTKQQVEQLLEDIDSFTPRELKNDPSKKTFYCLQPVVLKKLQQDTVPDRKFEGDWYEVIDGQQRLTTIYLILKYRNERWLGDDKEKLFNIDYETREKCVEFLDSIRVNDDKTTVNIEKKYIDFYHISKAYQVIRDWELNYENRYKKKFDKNDFQSKLLSHSKIIWYEVEQEENSVELFERLNLGKIPLTNAELTKALFLSNDSFSELVKEEQRIKHYEIASLWDEIEHKLNELDKKFWSFITNKKRETFDTRIELILDLIAKKPEEHIDPLFTFLKFLEKSKATANGSEVSALSKTWEEIEQFYHTLIEWNNDRDLYHMIGYLVSSREVKGYEKQPLNELVAYSINNTKEDFWVHLNKRIRESVNFEPSELRYDEHPDRLFNLLLLFNVETYRTSISIDDYYPFKQHKSNQWSLEHIHAQNSEGLDQTKKVQWTQWLDLHIPVIKDLRKHPKFKENIADIDTIISEGETYSANIDRLNWPLFQDLFTRINKILSHDSGHNGNRVHGLGNMALLSQPDNAALNNSAFEVKRREVIRLDQQGSFIPICTRRVFQGYYSNAEETEEKFIWSPVEEEAYIKKITDSLNDYLPRATIGTNGGGA